MSSSSDDEDSSSSVILEGYIPFSTMTRLADNILNVTQFCASATSEETLDEAEDFLEECMAVVVDSVDDVIEYFDEAGMDVDGAVDDEILEADEVFDIGDGRYLIVEA